MSRRLLALAGLVATYLLVLGSVDPYDVTAGAIVAVGVLFAFRRFLGYHRRGRVERPLGRLVALVPFLVVVLRDIVVGTWQVAATVLHLRPLVRPGIVAVPFGRRTDQGVLVSAFVATLSPGEFLVEVDHERRVLLMHVLDARDPDGVRARHEAFYERWQRPVFP